jgi:hypothetical protein
MIERARIDTLRQVRGDETTATVPVGAGADAAAP